MQPVPEDRTTTLTPGRKVPAAVHGLKVSACVLAGGAAVVGVDAVVAGALVAFTVEGRVAPCSFAASTRLPATDLASHAGDPDLAAWRAWVDRPAEPCASCSLRAVCKGGCKVVAGHLEGALGPDPECPRVIAWRRERAA